MKRIACLLALGCATTLAYAETPEHYHYGMRLDIAKVISMDVPAGGCEVVTARMTYVDSKGETHETTYLRQGPDCHDF